MACRKLCTFRDAAHNKPCKGGCTPIARGGGGGFPPASQTFTHHDLSGQHFKKKKPAQRGRTSIPAKGMPGPRGIPHRVVNLRSTTRGMQCIRGSYVAHPPLDTYSWPGSPYPQEPGGGGSSAAQVCPSHTGLRQNPQHVGYDPCDSSDPILRCVGLFLPLDLPTLPGVPASATRAKAKAGKPVHDAPKCSSALDCTTHRIRIATQAHATNSISHNATQHNAT